MSALALPDGTRRGARRRSRGDAGDGLDVSYARVARLSAPMVAATATGIGAQLVVTGLIGHMDGAALYVRAVYMPIAFLFLAATTGLSVTLQVAVAQCRGRGDDAQIRRYFGGVVRSGALVYLVLGAALACSAGLLATAMRVPPGRQPAFHAFLLAMTAATAVGMVGELGSAVLRGLGRTGTSAVVTAVYVSCYLGTVVVGGLVLHGGLIAVAAGAGLAGTAEIALGLGILARSGVLPPSAVAAWKPGVPRLLAAIGLPVSASFIVLSVVNLVLLRIVAPAGQSAVAGFTVGYTVQTFVIVPAVGLGSAVSVLMNQAVAAGAVTAARTAFRRGMVIALAGYAAVTVAVLTAGGPAVSLMTGNPVIAADTRHFLAVVGPSFGCTALVLTALTVLEQVGHGPLAALLNAGYFAAVLIAGWLVMASTANLTDLYLTLLIAALVGLVTGLPIACAFAMRPRALRDPGDGGGSSEVPS